jgi:hypothetical protein
MTNIDCKYFLPFHRLFLHSVDCFFWWADVFLVWCNLNFSFVACEFGVRSKKSLLRSMLWGFVSIFSYHSFTVSGHTFSSLIHFELIFGHGIKFHSFASFLNIMYNKDYIFLLCDLSTFIQNQLSIMCGFILGSLF